MMRVLLLIVACGGLLWVLGRFRKRQLSAWGAGAWAVLAIAIGVVALIPEVTNRLADLLGIGRGADVVLYTAIVAIVAMLFRISIRIEQLDRAITTVTRELALREHDQRAVHQEPVSNR